ncbi:hypothetical protein H5410_007074 [Solanum commersonii]|uniref:Ankyrin repeat-containing protein n=1 Tax=Solanum commersonii TaxID=4109 RepID=A0A9J6ABH5_SOLCO|nr:hypothetical protein H5410_007074 [Solanum commersonii]
MHLLYLACKKNKSQDEELPITAAASIGHKDMVSYLFEVTDLHVLQQQERLNLLHITIQNEMYDVALNMFNKDRKLVSKMLEAGNICVLHALSQKSLAIGGNYLKRFAVWRKFISLISMGRRQSISRKRVNNDGNNILHLAGKLGEPINKQQKSSGQMEALKNKLVQSVPPNADNNNNNTVFVESLQQLFQEIEIIRHITETQSVKEVEKLVPLSFHKDRNKDGKTPRELFTEEHKALLKDGEKWMKDTANSCMIAATLIATMMQWHYSPQIISILTSHYAEDDFLVTLPAKLFFGLTVLFVSIVSMLVAFTATFVLIYRNHTGWQPKLIVACAGVPVALFGCLQYKLWFDVAKSTYWSKFLFRSAKQYKFD